MASKKSYTITLSNNSTEKQAQDYLLKENPNFIMFDLEGRKAIMELMGIDKKFGRAFDLIMVKGHTNLEKVIELNDPSLITLIELKTTQKYLPELPKGFFFGATENEFDLAKHFGDQYQFCFVSLHQDSLGYALTTEKEMNKLVRNKRVQYQINL